MWRWIKGLLFVGVGYYAGTQLYDSPRALAGVAIATLFYLLLRVEHLENLLLSTTRPPSPRACHHRNCRETADVAFSACTLCIAGGWLRRAHGTPRAGEGRERRRCLQERRTTGAVTRGQQF